MIKTREICDPSSCINQAEADEPVFVLRAHDECAPATVLAWAASYVRLKGGWAVMTDKQKAKYQEAMEQARAMKVYAVNRGWIP